MKVQLVTRRVLATVMASLLLFVAGCGSDSGSASENLDLKVNGAFDTAPTFSFDKDFHATDLKTKVLVEGKGEAVKPTDSVELKFAIGDPLSPDGLAYDGFSGGGMQLTDSTDLWPGFREVFKGRTYGSRLLVTGSAQKVFQEGGVPDYGVGNKDSVALVIDIGNKFTVPITEKHPEVLPGIVEKGGKVTGLDFAGVKKPKAKWPVARKVVKQGAGETITKDMTVTVNYYGAVYGSKKAFDESYSKEPATFELGRVVPGWTWGLDGMKVGSRVLLAIPPRFGYGDEGQKGIPANSTLYFVIDIESATTDAPAQ